MPELHLKRMIICLAIGLWFGFQTGWKGQEIINSNPITKFVTTGRF